MNVKMLRKVEKAILATPARFNMVYYGTRVTDSNRKMLHGILADPPCHTQACIAGEACLVGGKAFVKQGGGLELVDAPYSYAPWDSFATTARRVLELTIAQSNRLFYLGSWDPRQDRQNWGWPDKFERQYWRAKTPRARALATVRRIEHFIKTEGRE